MAQIRVLLVELPGMLRDLVVDALMGRPDINVVGEIGEAESPAELASTARDTGADVVIVALRDEENELRPLDAVLYALPRLKVMGIARDGRNTYLREMHLRTVALGNIAPDELAETIREAIGRPAMER